MLYLELQFFVFFKNKMFCLYGVFYWLIMFTKKIDEEIIRKI